MHVVYVSFEIHFRYFFGFEESEPFLFFFCIFIYDFYDYFYSNQEKHLNSKKLKSNERTNDEYEQ